MDQKHALRLQMKKLRAERVAAADASLAAEAAADRLVDVLDGAGATPPRIIALYWPLAHEMDCRPAIARLRDRGYGLALPVMDGRDQPLHFRVFQPGDPLRAGPFGVQEPEASAPEVRPDIILVPLLAFDAGCHRLGYGGGYYDRTLQKLRADDLHRTGAGIIMAVGFAFDSQRVDAVPSSDNDQVLDLVVTELAVYGALPGSGRGGE